MNERIDSIKKFFIVDGAHKKYRRELDWSGIIDRRYFDSLSDAEKVTLVFEKMLENEEPVVFPFDNIPFVRTVVNFPYELFGTEKSPSGGSGLFPVDISPDISRLLDCGFEDKIAEIEQFMSVCQSPAKRNYLACVKRSLEAVLKLADRYRVCAEKAGNHFVATMLQNIPAQKPQSFIGAVAMVRIINYAMWCTGCRGNYLGRPDIYLYEYYRNDIQSGRLTDAEALSIIEEFLLSSCKDSDLYVSGNGVLECQPLVLGGHDEYNITTYNPLSDLFIRASSELMLPEPKIFIRVNQNTPSDVYSIDPESAAECGGYPCFLNDDAIIKLLVGWGYDRIDACKYTVSSRGEPVIPGLSMDFREAGRVDFIASAERSLRISLGFASDMDTVMDIARSDIENEIRMVCENTRGIHTLPAPFHSVMFEGSIENAKDVTLGCKYNNYGINGVGIPVAADMFATVGKFVFEDKTVPAGELLDVLIRDHNNNEPLLKKYRKYGPKTGWSSSANEIANDILKMFSTELAAMVNERGGIFKAGVVSCSISIGLDTALGSNKDLPEEPDVSGDESQAEANEKAERNEKIDTGKVTPVHSYNNASPYIRPHAYTDVFQALKGGVLLAVLDRSLVSDADTLQKISYKVNEMIINGSHAVQIEIADLADLHDAMVNPAAHDALMIRLWPSRVRFTRLDRRLQEYIISRTYNSV